VKIEKMERAMSIQTSRILSRLFTVIVLAALAAAPLSGQERRTALVIGNGAYRASPLRNPPNDATDMAAALRSTGFNVSLLTDAGRAAMEKAIRDFGSALKAGGEGLFYYAGHGVQVRGNNYLLGFRPMSTDAFRERRRFTDPD
jgi:hypothetical protein